jgi:hypothetical protein
MNLMSIVNKLHYFQMLSNLIMKIKNVKSHKLITIKKCHNQAHFTFEITLSIQLFCFTSI